MTHHQYMALVRLIVILSSFLRGLLKSQGSLRGHPSLFPVSPLLLCLLPTSSEHTQDFHMLKRINHPLYCMFHSSYLHFSSMREPISWKRFAFPMLSCCSLHSTPTAPMKLLLPRSLRFFVVCYTASSLSYLTAWQYQIVLTILLKNSLFFLILNSFLKFNF